MEYTKHEVITCERCGDKIECKANNYTQCQCAQVSLNLNELQYISENYEECMCAHCLEELAKEYRESLKI
ncbi:MAG: cysteine-rich CWC family protein [Sphingobacteriales bacterium]|nr:cysteine-rich CWC family protein [Sphingobacteriales bacterium]